MARDKFSFHNILVFLTVAVALCAGAAVFVSGSVDSATCDTEGVWSLGVRLGDPTVMVEDQEGLQNAIASGDLSITFSNDIPINKTIVISKDVAITIYGNGKKLHGTGLTGPVISIDTPGPTATTITINNLTITGGNNNDVKGGGGIYVSGKTILNINDSTISNNSARGGGGIEIDSGSADIRNSTIANNTATTSNSAGGILLGTTAYLYLQNSTVFGNSASSYGGIGIIGSSARAEISFCTIANNTATSVNGIYIYTGNTFSIDSSIVVGTNEAIQQIHNLGAATSLGYNVFGRIQNFNRVDTDEPSEISYITVFGTNAALADNDTYRYTQTVALIAGSPAIGKVPPQHNMKDQRGYPRPGENKTSMDAGAFETPGANVKVTGVSMDKSSTTIKVGETEKITATILPSNATKKTVTWSSNNSAIATVSDGTVTGVAIGNATITVKTDDGNFTANCAVTISSSDVKVTGVSLNKSSTIIKVGETEKLSAAISPANATNQKITWSSNNGAIATVSDGNVTGVANGSATITVKTDDGGFTADCAVLVSTDAPVSADPVLNPRTLNLIEEESGTIVSDSDGTWRTGDNSIINMKTSARSVEVIAKKLGKATITFTRTSDKKTAEASVFVEAKAVKEVNDKLKSDDVGINILSPDLFTSVDARIEPTAPTMVCYEPSGKPAGVIEVDISDTAKYPDVNNVFLPMQYTLGLSEAEIKKNCENVGREINIERLFSKDGTPDSDIVDEFFRVFVIQKEILQGTRKGQLARLLGQGKDQVITPGDAIKSGILTLTVSTAERKVYLEFRYFVKDGDMSPSFNGKDLIIGDGLGDRLIVDPLWTSTRKASGGNAPDGGSGCNAGWGVFALVLISLRFCYNGVKNKK